MAKPEHEPSARLEQALTESQRLERQEQHVAMEKQRASDERMVTALSSRRDE